jgi:hypothetical protein
MMNMKEPVRRLANAVGIELHKASGWRWSHHVEGYYPVDSNPRWGYGKPAHPELSNLLKANQDNFASLIQAISRHGDLLKSIPLEGDDNGTTPFYRNGWFEDLDAVALAGILACKKPKRYFEIGSGNSTKIARHSVTALGLSTTIVSVDPEPRASIDALCDTVVRTGLECADLSLFSQLEAGDILFFDGSHRTFTNSDVTVFFLEIIPRLKPGITIHIHDIFLPVDYPPEWNRRLYSEQYILAAMLLGKSSLLNTILPNWYVCNDGALARQVAALLEPLGLKAQGWSYWIETV